MIKKIAANILAILKMNDIKVSEFEERNGVSRGYLSRKANNGGAFDLGVALAMADELGVQIDGLRKLDYVRISEKAILEKKIAKLQEELKNLEKVGAEND